MMSSLGKKQQSYGGGSSINRQTTSNPENYNFYSAADEINRDASWQMQNEMDKNWFELRLNGKCPERRAYHSTFIANDCLYIFGGQDIREGSIQTMWMLDLNNLIDLDLHPNEQTGQLEWKQVEMQGSNQPKAISHHSSCVHNQKMYLYGGIKPNGEENTQIYVFDTTKDFWEIVKPKNGQQPVSRDEHTCNVYRDSLIIFGGFEDGITRSNSIITFNLVERIWEVMDVAKESPVPEPRAGHSSVVHGDTMLIMGGKCEGNAKLNDVWEFNFVSRSWRQIEAQTNDPSKVILERSGHCAQVYNNQMLIFGGIHEVTQELDDMPVLNPEKGEWTLMSEMTATKAKDQGSPRKGQTSNNSQLEAVKDKSSNSNNNMSMQMQLKSTQKGRSNGGESPSPQRRMTQAPDMIMRKDKQSLKLDTQGANAHEGTLIELVSPTSVNMKNSFIIQNSDPNFDAYYKQINKRRATGGNSPDRFNQHNDNNLCYGKVRYRKPAARDGHTGVVWGDYFMVFGGDRHHMPFNDLYMLDLKAEFEEKYNKNN